MKTVIILGLIFFILQNEAKSLRSKRSQLLQLVYRPEPEEEDCLNKMNLDKDEIGRIILQESHPEGIENYNKYLVCYWTNKGYLNKNGNINYDALKEMIIDIFENDFDIDFVKTFADAGVEQCRGIDAESTALKIIRTDNCILKTLRDIAQ